MLKTLIKRAGGGLVQRSVWRKREYGSSETEQVTSSLALVRTLPMPPPAAKLQGVVGNAQATVR